MWSKFRSAVIADIRFLFHGKSLLGYILLPVFIVAFLLFVFPSLSEYILSKTGFRTAAYYPLAAIFLVSVIPVVYGILYSFIPFENGVRRALICERMVTTAIISFVIIWSSVSMVIPVSGQGWLRNLFAAILFSAEAPFTFLFFAMSDRNKMPGKLISWLFIIFLLAAPAGLLLHHPFNYLAFFSPFYWIACAWIVRSPGGGLIYGAVAVFLSAAMLIILFYGKLIGTFRQKG
jgi:hypothetical protein